MPINILMPALSPTMEEGTLAKWLVKEGDQVSSGAVLAEIETDKATMEFEAIDDGTIGKIVVPEGTEGVKVNDLIAVLLEEGESAEDLSDEATEKSEAPASPDAGTVSKPSDGAPASGSTQTSPAPAAPKSSEERLFASPLARRIAADRGLDLTAIKGSGPGGRIVKSDVEAAERQPGPPPPTESQPAAERQDSEVDRVKSIYEGREFEEIRLDGMRKTIAARLSESKQTIPHFYLRRDVIIDDLVDFRGDAEQGA